MKHKIRIKHRIVEGILSSIVGGALVGAFIQRQYWLIPVAAIVAIALLVEEEAAVEEEEAE